MAENLFKKVAEQSATKIESRSEVKLVKVEATLMGWYDRKRVNPGDILEIPENLVSKKWMKIIK